MRIDLWSDLVCPWCAIGKAHLDQALLAFEHADEVTVLWRSFELDPGAPAVRDGTYSSQLASRYGTSPRGGSAMVGRISAAAERAGVQARFDLVRPANTFDAHRLLHLAKECGVQDRLASRLTRAYLAEGELLSDHATLQRLAGEAGLAEGVEATLSSGAYSDHVRADEAEAARRDISAVPTLLIDERHVIPGAQSPQSMLATICRAWSRQGE
jgi:predicted DsbA family dithiol-disulfide isomerase